MFPVDDDPPPNEPSVRFCPDCNVLMRVRHSGTYAKVFVCPDCGVTLTVPPKLPRIDQ